MNPKKCHCGKSAWHGVLCNSCLMQIAYKMAEQAQADKINKVKSKGGEK